MFARLSSHDPDLGAAGPNVEGLEKFATDHRRLTAPISPLQERSRETVERLLDTASMLLDGRDFDSIPVTELCDTAGVSTSSFYARFATKDDLLVALHERHLSELHDKTASLAGDIDWDSMTIREVVRRLASLYVSVRRLIEPRAQTLGIAELRYPDLAARRADLDQSVADLLSAYLATRIDDDWATQTRIELAIRTLCAGMQQAVHMPRRFLDSLELGDEQFLDEIAEMFMSYLRIDPDH